MDNRNMLQLCRLCLVKDDVNIPIFEEHGDIRQIFLKISSCLPVKVSREDKLPKKICDGCSFKLDTLYEFCNTSANAEKQLLTWLGEAGMNSQMVDGTISAVTQQIKPTDTFVKQETIEPPDIHNEDNDDDKDYMFQQKFEESASAGPSATVTSNEEEEPPPPKRARRTAAVKAAIAMDHDSDDDDDSGEPMTKVEDESEESEGDDQEPSFADAPSTSADDQPGPSGVGKDGVEAPFFEQYMMDSDSLEETYPEYDTLEMLKSRPQDSKKIKYECGICFKTFKSGIFAEEHSKYFHTGETPFECDICSERFMYSRSLKKHRHSKHANVPKTKEKYFCTICDKEYISLNGLKNHNKKYHSFFHEDRSVACEICGKTLSSRNKLSIHLRIHTGLKLFSCDICLKNFSRKEQMKEHQRVHTGEKPYKCQFCGRGFTQRTPMKAHERIHSINKPYSCGICKKSYFSRGALGTHEKVCTKTRKKAKK